MISVASTLITLILFGGGTVLALVVLNILDAGVQS